MIGVSLNKITRGVHLNSRELLWKQVTQFLQQQHSTKFSQAHQEKNADQQQIKQVEAKPRESRQREASRTRETLTLMLGAVPEREGRRMAPRSSAGIELVVVLLQRYHKPMSIWHRQNHVGNEFRQNQNCTRCTAVQQQSQTCLIRIKTIEHRQQSFRVKHPWTSMKIKVQTLAATD